MIVERLILGAYETNCYILRSSETATDCLIIDAGFDGDKLVGFLRQHNFNPVALVLTHGHIDHIAGVIALRTEFPDIKVYIHELDVEMFTHPEQNLSAFAGYSFTTEPADSIIRDGDIIEKAGVKFQVLHTPGHTSGGISLYSEQDGIAFVGDALFAGSVGRTDFPGGDMARLIASIKDKLLKLPDKTVVYPGHGPATTIGEEKVHNQYLQ
jgi:hydroxyacylglutathione hydrolase